MIKILYIKIKKNKRLTRTIKSAAGEGLSWRELLAPQPWSCGWQAPCAAENQEVPAKAMAPVLLQQHKEHSRGDPPHLSYQATSSLPPSPHTSPQQHQRTCENPASTLLLRPSRLPAWSQRTQFAHQGQNPTDGTSLSSP